MLQNIYCYLKVSRFSLQVYQIIEYLGRNHNITSEGLFRKHGNLKKQQALKERLNKVPAYLKNYVLISVVDSKLFYPDPTFLLFLDSDPDPIFPELCCPVLGQMVPILLNIST